MSDFVYSPSGHDFSLPSPFSPDFPVSSPFRSSSPATPSSSLPTEDEAAESRFDFNARTVENGVTVENDTLAEDMLTVLWVRTLLLSQCARNPHNCYRNLDLTWLKSQS